MEKNEIPLISIQILNWNRAEETLRAIKSALNQTYENKEIIVVDNGSTDNSLTLIQANFPEIKIVELDKNYGCPGGRNLGIEHCRGDFIFYLDNDGVLHEDAVSNAYKTISIDNQIGIVAGIVYDFESAQEIDASCKVKSFRKYSNNLFQGGICLIRKSIYEKTGYYPEHFIYGAEENHLSLKLFDSNYTIVKDESVILWHKKSLVARDKEKETLLAFYNKLYVAITLFPQKYALQYVSYFLYKYPYYSSKQGILFGFLKSFPTNFPKTVIRGLKNRDPVSKKAYNKYAENRKVKSLKIKK